MVSIQDIIKLSVTESDIKESIKKALAESFNKRDNLRKRDSNIQFDCLLRGYIGEKAIVNWFPSYGITFDKINYMEDTSGDIDIDLLFTYNVSSTKSIEIKTSLIPDNYVKEIDKNDIQLKIQKCIENFDIKLIRRNSEPIEKLRGDIHLQIYFGDLRKTKDEFLKNITINVNIEKESIENSLKILVDNIYNTIFAKFYINRTFLVSWIDKETLIKQINNKTLKEQKWTFGGSKREFWTCKIISESRPPIELINYLKRLQNGN